MIEKIRKVVESLGYPFFFGTRDEVYAYINRVRTCVAVYRQGNATGASQSLVFKFKGNRPQKMYYDVFAELKKVLTIGVQRTFFYDDVVEVRCPVMAKTYTGGAINKKPNYLWFSPAEGTSEVRCPVMAKTYTGGAINKKPNYLWFSPAEGTSEVDIALMSDEETSPLVIEYSCDGREWIELNFFNSEGVTVSETITVNYGEMLFLRGNNPNGMSGFFFDIPNPTRCGGDINTLINKVGGDIEISQYQCYSSLFAVTSITSAPLLPSTVITGEGAYRDMFYQCMLLENPPKLPAKQISTECYVNMFGSCEKLKSSPSLPAENLTPSCYSMMFQNCTQLSLANPISAINYELESCLLMFAGCTSLEIAPNLTINTWGSYCITAMFNGCSSLRQISVNCDEWVGASADEWVLSVSANGVFRKPSGTSIPTGTNGIPSGWTVENF